MICKKCSIEMVKKIDILNTEEQIIYFHCPKCGKVIIVNKKET